MTSSKYTKYWDTEHDARSVVCVYWNTEHDVVRIYYVLGE